MRWARFHLGDGRAQDGIPVLPEDVLHRMTEPTAELRSSTLGDALGICWCLRDVAGVRTVGHGGSANGQFAELLIVPDRDFAVVTLSNSGPDNGLGFNHAVIRFALKHYLGVVERNPGPLPYDEARGSSRRSVPPPTPSCPRIFRPLPSAWCPETRTSTSSAAGA